MEHRNGGQGQGSGTSERATSLAAESNGTSQNWDEGLELAEKQGVAKAQFVHDAIFQPLDGLQRLAGCESFHVRLSLSPRSLHF